MSAKKNAGRCASRLSDTRLPDATSSAVTSSTISDPVPALVLDLLEWVGTEGRPYAEVLEAWRTSCPRLPVWEEADAGGYLHREYRQGTLFVGISPAGVAHLLAHRPGTV